MSQQVGVWRELDLKGSARIKGLKVVEKTSDYTVTKKDSGTIFIGNHATTQVNLTVPIGDGGEFYFFLSKGAAGIKITGATADKIICINDAAADSLSLETLNEKIGGGFLVFSDGTNLYAIHLNPGGSQTVTIAT
jgi:hypothetical protein